MSAALVLYWTMNNVFAVARNWLFNQFIAKSTSGDIVNNKTKLFDDILVILKANYRNMIMIISFVVISFLVAAIISLRTGFDSFNPSRFIILLALIELLVLFTLVDIIRRNLHYSLKAIIPLSILIINAYAFFRILSLSHSRSNVLLVLIYMLIVYLIVYTIFNYKNMVRFNLNRRKLSHVDIIPSLLLLFPLIIYHLNNLEYFIFTTTLIYYFILYILPMLVLVLSIHLFNGMFDQKQAIITFISVLLTYYLLAIATNIFSSNAQSNTVIHFILLIVVYSSLRYLYYNYNKVLNFLAIILVLSSLTSGLFNIPISHSSQKFDAENRNTNIYGYLNESDMINKPDIYFLVYDAYVSISQMVSYEIDNNEFCEFLIDSGFVLYDNVYTNAPESRGSIGGVLDFQKTSYLQPEINRLIGGNSIVDNVLQRNGYRTHYVLNNYLLRGRYKFGGDYAFPVNSKYADLKTTLLCILVGEFRFDMELRNDDDKIAWEERQTEIIKRQSGYPKFLYSHSMLPGHSQNSGKLLEKDRINYTNNVKLANIKMKSDVREILSRNNNAIIILAGDHGPYLTGDALVLDGYKENEVNGLHILDRYGVFLAIKYPNDAEPPAKSDIVLLQNVFLHIFADLFEDDTILNYGLDLATLKLGAIPDGAIDNGKIMYGLDKGKNINEIFSQY